MTERLERTEDLYLVDMGSTPPVEEGQIRQTGGDIVAFIGGSVKSLTLGEGFDPAKVILTVAGTMVYVGDGDLVLKV